MINQLQQNLYITYSNQKARDLKSHVIANPLDRVVTLDALIAEIFELSHFQIIIDETIGAAILHKIIQDHAISYFAYLKPDAESFVTIYDFIVKCKRNEISFATLIDGEKLGAIEQISSHYAEYKSSHNLADISDIEELVLREWDEEYLAKYSDLYIDNFVVADIRFIKSKRQEQILEKLEGYKHLTAVETMSSMPQMIEPSTLVFDNIDEVKSAIQIARKLLLGGADSRDILIVASDIQEYAPLYKLFLDEYGMCGYSSMGTPLGSFYSSTNPQVKTALRQYRSELESLTALYGRLGLRLSEATKEQIKSSITILDEKIGIELTEPNQLVGLRKSYKHIIFIGTDINHFPPISKDNFLYSYEDSLQYFYANSYFTSSQTQLAELKRLCDNLYIITASYKDKRELSPSILLDGKYDATIDISDIQSVSALSLEGQTVTPDANTAKYYESITAEALTQFDGHGVEGVDASHLSASQINKYLSCPLAYLYSNKVKIKAPKQSEEGFDVMEQGSLMHLCYELFGRRIREQHITDRDRESLYSIMLEVSVEAYHHPDTIKPRGKKKRVENIHHQVFLSTLQAGLGDDRKAGLLAKFVDYYIASADEFAYFKHSEFEKEFALDNELKPCLLVDAEDQNYFIKGFIDRFDNLDRQINIIDYKSKKISSKAGKDQETQEKIDELADVQLALYLLYAKQQFPTQECYSAMLSFKGDSKVSHFAELHDGDFTEAYEEKLRGIVFDTKASIENGEFGFDNSDEKACGWCDIKHICHEGVLSKKIEELA